MYIEKKYNFRFPFNKNNRCLHEQAFGCCSYHDRCTKENFCIIPESYGDGKKYCMLSKRMGFDKLGAIRIKRKIVRFRKPKRD